MDGMGGHKSNENIISSIGLTIDSDVIFGIADKYFDITNIIFFWPYT